MYLTFMVSARTQMLGRTTLITTHFLFQISNYEWFELAIFVVMGLCGGLLGALFNDINIKLTLFRLRYTNITFISENVKP